MYECKNCGNKVHFAEHRENTYDIYQLGEQGTNSEFRSSHLDRVICMECGRVLHLNMMYAQEPDKDSPLIVAR